MRLGRFFIEHSLSLAMGVGFIVSSILSYVVEQGSWAYDFWMMVAGGFGGSLVLLVLAPRLWEKDADPTKPPK